MLQKLKNGLDFPDGTSGDFILRIIGGDADEPEYKRQNRAMVALRAEGVITSLYKEQHENIVMIGAESYRFTIDKDKFNERLAELAPIFTAKNAPFVPAPTTEQVAIPAITAEQVSRAKDGIERRYVQLASDLLNDAGFFSSLSEYVQYASDNLALSTVINNEIANEARESTAEIDRLHSAVRNEINSAVKRLDELLGGRTVHGQLVKGTR
jgi:hypothetical protein